MAWMVYLIIVTARSTPKVYDPYEILGVSRVSGMLLDDCLNNFLINHTL